MDTITYTDQDSFNNYTDNINHEYNFPEYSIYILLCASCGGALYRTFKLLANNCSEYYKEKNKLKISTVDSNDEEKLLNECTICIEKYKKHEKIITLDCNHEFHSKCIKKWLNLKKSCPNCRENIY